MRWIIAARRAAAGFVPGPTMQTARQRLLPVVVLWMISGACGPGGQDEREPRRPPVAWAPGAEAGPSSPPEDDTVAASARFDGGPAEGSGAAPPAAVAPEGPQPPPRAPALPPATTAPVPQQPWERVTAADIERDLHFQRLPPDAGVVAPIARLSDRRDSFVVEHLDCIELMLDEWGPAHESDPVQRVRNVLYLAAAPDVLQMEQIESVVPLVVFDWLQREIPAEQLPGLLYWVALHPFDGDDSAAERFHGACLEIDPPEDRELLRYRAGMYAAKLLGRLSGRLPVR